MANVLPMEKRVSVASCLVEGASVRATARQTGVSAPTILSLLVRLGAGCDRIHDRLVRDLAIRDIECDEIWSYIQKKQARVTAEDPAEWGDAYTFLAMARVSKLMIAYRVGKRDEMTTRAFIADLRARLVTVPQISTDGFKPYPVAVGQSFGTGHVDYAQIHKDYRRKRVRDDDHRYEPPRDPFITKEPVFGAPDMARASTSHIERANLTVRMHVRRFTRLTNAFSRKLENHRAAVSLHVAFYNFVRVHETLRVTPAMEAGLTDHVWTVDELVARALAALDEPEVEKPVPQPLRLPDPPPAPAGEEAPAPAARELPNGRGWLRVLPGGKGKATAPPAAPPPPASPVLAKASPEPREGRGAPAATPPARVQACAVGRDRAATSAGDVPPWTQLDLLAWRPKPRTPVQLSLFGPDDTPCM